MTKAHDIVCTAFELENRSSSASLSPIPPGLGAVTPPLLPLDAEPDGDNESVRELHFRPNFKFFLSPDHSASFRIAGRGWYETPGDERAGDGDDDEDPVNPENLSTNFFGINLAAPEWGVGWANPADARGVSSVIGIGRREVTSCGRRSR